ncbi:AER335Wp [Eremothecium gossypii ATCC 10895]|uniref:Mevalonate kinase n=1 Tax=Eremothecium gossypii (strain ATCC 10895 / CBS 109.51 / FGSC 9923 / NRRL Y-1056) TaxID=284811 RepID=Q756D2_EREGS|nr:AER335Wp [Eremothecium gossypii ATCC 10895]AAS53015.1 AER335Wp [Eremothecium gossypii ATCC 10895]AEY97323.1 FAER335Wp [Eremothecium gossypii FDAG1]
MGQPMTVICTGELLPFITSAPGKVIIFGEHSAVYNKPAIAASVSSLRTYLFVEADAESDAVRMEFPDIGFQYSWKHEALTAVPREAVVRAFCSRELDAEVLAHVDRLLMGLEGALARHAALCFLYIYTCLCREVQGVRFTVKSTLPIGAGLGSSASIAVCLALAMGRLGGHVQCESGALTKEQQDFVNRWALVGEQCIHGTPSGIDNAVATYGDAVLFQRQPDGSTKFDHLSDFPQMPMILTNTKVPKSTKVLVANVGKLVEQEPLITAPILNTMAQVVTQAHELLPLLQGDDTVYTRLLQLVRINHGLLVALGVSHPSLEHVRALCDTLGIGATKLTGAGGGGCALTLLKRDVEDELVEQFRKTLLDKHGYESFTTGLGGVGCCLATSQTIRPHLDRIKTLFQEDTPQQQLAEALLPGASPIDWIHG